MRQARLEPDEGRIPPHPARAGRRHRLTTGRPTTGRPTATWRQLPRPARVVGIAAVLSALTAVLLAHELFPLLSINNDEPIYRLQAQTLAAGRLFPPALRPAAAFAPWLAAVADGHHVLKYTPVVPAFYALSLLLTGGTAVALALIAAAAVVVTYLLGVEVLADRRVAAVAAVLFALSPLVVVQSGLLLPYLPVVVLLELAALGALRGVRGGRRGPLVGAGLAVGLVVFARAYDAVLFLAPIAGWVLLAARGRRRWLLGWVAVGAALPIAGFLAFNTAATGHPLRLPFSLLEPGDRLGFGVRKLYPTADPRRFGPRQGVIGVAAHLWLLTGWAFGGIVLAPLAAVAAVRRRVPGPALALAAGGLLLIVGYLGFWGAWNATVLWGGTRYVGPFYFLPVLVPLVLLGARGLVDLVGRSRGLALAAVVAATAASAVAVVVAVPANLGFTRHDRDIERLVATQPRPLVFVSAAAPFLMHPSPVAANPPRLDGPALYAVARGDADLSVAADRPDRTPYLLRLPARWNLDPNRPVRAALERLRLVSGPQVRLPLTVDPLRSAAGGLRLVVGAGGRRVGYPLDPCAATRATLVVGPDGATVEGLGAGVPDPTAATGADSAVGVEVTVLAAGGGGGVREVAGRPRLLDRQLVPARRAGAGVEVLAPDRQVGLPGEGTPPPLRIRSGEPTS